MSYTFGYPRLYSNGLNNNTQIRRAVDMVYQRGGNYNIVLTGDTYVSSMELDVDIYANDELVGRMSLVPYQITSGSTFTYNFNLRPYDYLSNYIESQHYTNYRANDFYTTNLNINYNNPYPNIIDANFKYGYRYITGSTTIVSEYDAAGAPFNDLVHYSDIPYCISETTFTPSGTTNTGNHFDYVGGAFQMGVDKFYLPNFDQELGTTIGSGITISSNVYRRLSPMSQYLMDYPTVPEMSETGRFLTDAPRIQYIQSDENYVLYYLNGQSGDRQVIEADYAVVEFFDSSNTIISAYTINQQLNYVGTTYASPTGYTDTLTIFSLPCGPVDIQNIINSSIDWNAITYYTVQLFYSYPTNSELRSSIGPIGPISEQFYFYLYTNCQPENTRLAFLNARGGYDYYTFKSYRQDTKKISAQSFDSRYYSTDLAGPDRDFGRATKTFATDLNTEIILESEYLSVPEANWLEQLFYSPQVYEMKADYISPIGASNTYYKDLRPLQVLSTDVETITKKHRKLNKYRITLKYANNFFINRGF